MNRIHAIPASILFALILTIGCQREGMLSPQNDEQLSGPSPKKTKLDAPSVNCAGSTQHSINLEVCAGATGLPAGFSIQWMTKAAYEANGGWLASDDPGICKASFSGNANGSRYNLGANECATVNVGEFLIDAGASTNCGDALVCGTEYVFRAFAHATSSLQRSDFTGNKNCSTLDCGGCTLTQGYWKTHGPDPNGNNANEWPVTELMLGSVNYSDVELLAILNKPAAGNGLLTLAHQLIAAKLNIANGANGSSIADAIADADALIGSLVIPPSGTGMLAPAATSALTTALREYNEGETPGAAHCD